MINLFDSGFLLVLFDPRARVPHDKTTGKPVIDRAQEKIEHLVQTMSERHDKIIIPSPVLAEFMLLAGDRRNEYLTIMRRKAVFEIAGFNDPEAVELVEYSLRISPDAKFKARTPETWAKLNFDRQIVAIALTNRGDAVYSMDDSVLSLAKQVGLTPIGLKDLPLPPPSQKTIKPIRESLSIPNPPPHREAIEALRKPRPALLKSTRNPRRKDLALCPRSPMYTPRSFAVKWIRGFYETAENLQTAARAHAPHRVVRRDARSRAAYIWRQRFDRAAF